LNLDSVFKCVRHYDLTYYMCDSYTDNNLIIIHTVARLHINFFSLFPDDPQLRWVPGLPPAKSGLSTIGFARCTALPL